MFTVGQVFAPAQLSLVERQSTLLRTCGVRKDDQDELSAGDCFLIWFDLQLRRFPALAPAERRAIVLNEVRLWFRKVGERLYGDLQDTQPKGRLLQFVVADQRYLTWTGCTGFFDIETVAYVPSLEQPALESTACNLVELFRRSYAICTNLAMEGKHDGDPGAKGAA